MFRVPVAVGCTAIAVVSPEASVTATSASKQLRMTLPAASQPGSPVAPPVRVVATGARADSGAWELVAPPTPTYGGNSFNYYGGVLQEVQHDRWAGVVIGVTARPSTCGTQVLATHAVAAAVTHLLRSAKLSGASASG